MNKKNTFSSLMIGLMCLTAYGQGVGINTMGNTPDASAILDVSSSTQGVLISRMTQAERNAIVNPAVGLQIYNTDTDCFNFWNGATWRQSCYDCDFNAPSVGNNGPVCEGENLVLTAAILPGATYVWSGPNGFSSNQQNPVITSATVAAGGIYSLSVTLNGCTASAVTTVATVNATPNAPDASSNSPLCPGTTLNLAAETIIGASYSWNGPNGFSSTLQAPTISNISGAAAGTYSVAATVNGCTGPEDFISVSVNPAAPSAPSAITGTTLFVPGQSGVSYSIDAVNNATSYAWTLPSGASVESGQNTNSIIVNFGVSGGNICVTASNGCGTSSATCIAVSPCTSSFVNNIGWTQNIPTYESSQLPGSSYQATNTVDGDTYGTFWLSNNGLITNQWIIYDLGSEKTVSQIRIFNGQNPYSSKNMILQKSSSINGPWTNVFSFIAVDQDVSWQPFSGFTDTSRYWRLFFVDNYGSGNYIKLMEMQLYVCQ